MAAPISLDKVRARKKVNAVQITLGERIRLVRQNNGLSQDDLGRRIGYSQPEVSRLETGKVKNISGEAAVLIAKSLGNAGILEAFCDGCMVGTARRVMVRVTIETQEAPPPEAA